MMKNGILITGSSGLIAGELSALLKKNGYVVTTIDRATLYSGPENIVKYLRNLKAVVHLAGAGLLRPWSEKNKKVIYNSRILTAKNLAGAIDLLPAGERPECFISASAVGIYQPGLRHNEGSDSFAGGFLGMLVNDWEQASEKLPGEVRRVIFRIGLVLDRNSAIIKKMNLPFRLGLGGRIGSGRQPFPFIHLSDLSRAFLMAVSDDRFKGVFNLTAPEMITNRQFTREYASLLKRPAYTVVPGWALRLLFGEASQILLESPEVVPDRLQALEFGYNYPTIGKTLGEIISHQKR